MTESSSFAMNCEFNFNWNVEIKFKYPLVKDLDILNHEFDIYLHQYIALSVL